MDILQIVTAEPGEKIETLEEKLKKRKILTERRQGEDIEHEEMSSPRINKKSVQLSYVELPVSNRPYKDENGIPIFLNDNNCYRLKFVRK